MQDKNADAELLEVGRLILKAIEGGKMKSLLWAAETKDGVHVFGMSDGYARQPYTVLKIVARAFARVNDWITAIQGEPKAPPPTGMMDL